MPLSWNLGPLTSWNPLGHSAYNGNEFPFLLNKILCQTTVLFRYYYYLTQREFLTLKISFRTYSDVLFFLKHVTNLAETGGFLFEDFIIIRIRIIIIIIIIIIIESIIPFLEHRSSMSPFHFRLSAAKYLSSFQLLPPSLFIDLLQLFRGLSLFLFPWGFQNSALFCISPSSFLNVWPIHLNFLFLIFLF